MKVTKEGIYRDAQGNELPGRCPDGKETNSFNVYRKAWRKVYLRMEKITGLRCSGFDPSLSFYEVNDKNEILNGTSVQIPTWFALRIIKAVDNNK